LTPDQKLELQTAVEKARAGLTADLAKQNADNRAVLDRMAGITGVFTAILALCTFFTVKWARDDAKDQIAGSAKALDVFLRTSTDTLNALQKNVQLQLELLTQTAQADLFKFKNDVQSELDTLKASTDSRLAGMEDHTQRELERLKDEIRDFQKRLWAELPEMRNLKDNLQLLLVDLERVIPAESNWNDERPYESLSGRQKQRIQISESTVGALRIFISPDSALYQETLSKLYRALARFYFGKCRSEGQIADGERADAHVSSAIEIDRKNGSAYRLRGAIALAMNEILAPAAKTADQAEAERLLDQADTDLKTALDLDKNDLGAYYNRALVLLTRKEIAEALELSENTIGRLAEFPSNQIRKYAAPIYRNAGCFLALQAEKSATGEKRTELRERSIRMLQSAGRFLARLDHKASLDYMISAISNELKTGDFKNFEQTQKAELEELLKFLEARR
jgi:hypothetical protein